MDHLSGIETEGITIRNIEGYSYRNDFEDVNGTLKVTGGGTDDLVVSVKHLIVLHCIKK